MVYKEVDGKLVRAHGDGLAHGQAEEYRLAKKENRQPRCVHCGEPLDNIIQTQYVYLSWSWNAETKAYVKHDGDGDSEKAYCGNCAAHDWEFTEEEEGGYTFY